MASKEIQRQVIETALFRNWANRFWEKAIFLRPTTPRFFRDQTTEKRFANLLYYSDWPQTYRVAAHLIAKGARIIKLAALMWKNFSFGPKNVEKTGFLGFSDKTSGKHFANLLYCSNWAQTYRESAPLIAEGAPIIKLADLIGKNTFGPKIVKKMAFLGSWGLH